MRWFFRKPKYEYMALGGVIFRFCPATGESWYFAMALGSWKYVKVETNENN